MESVETSVRISQLREISQTRKLTQEEEAEAIALVRGDRKSAAVASAAKKSATAKADPTATLAKLAALMGQKK